jgi:hypothetical protein
MDELCSFSNSPILPIGPIIVENPDTTPAGQGQASEIVHFYHKNVEGTTMVKDINPGSDSSGPTSLTAYHGILYFSADAGLLDRGLWRSDGTAGV